MDDLRHLECGNPSPLVGEDRLGRSPSEEGGRRGQTQVFIETSGFDDASSRCEGAPCQAPPLSARASPESALPHKGGEGAAARWRAWFIIAGFSLATACLALWSSIAALGPLDLSAAEKRSTVVLDR